MKQVVKSVARITGYQPVRVSSARAGSPCYCAAVLLVLVAVGCRKDDQRQATEQAERDRLNTTEIISERPLPPLAKPMLIKQGPPPLVYMGEAKATLVFTNVTTGGELARALVGPRQIVRIDARRGVVMGETVLRAGPLPADHRYGIWLLPEGAGSIRTSTETLTPRNSDSR